MEIKLNVNALINEAHLMMNYHKKEKIKLMKNRGIPVAMKNNNIAMKFHKLIDMSFPIP